MNDTSLYIKISNLPDSIQKEVVDYMEFLIQKYKPKKSRKHPKAGCMKGTFLMQADFNEPLDDFIDYM